MTASGAYSIDVKLHAIGDLFKSIDPSPLVERDIDDEIEEFIVGWAREAPHGAKLRVVIHLQQAELFDAPKIRTSIANYFAYLSDRQKQRIRRLLHDGRRALAIGLLFLLACSLLGPGLSTIIGGAVGSMLKEGLLIIGWVANWRPVEIFLYDWRPMREQLRIYDRLAAAEIDFASTGASGKSAVASGAVS